MLTEKQARARDLYFVLGYTHAEIAVELRCKRAAVTRLVGRIRQNYLKAGIQPPAFDKPLRTVTARTLSGVWDRNTHEYIPTQN